MVGAPDAWCHLRARVVWSLVKPIMNKAAIRISYSTSFAAESCFVRLRVVRTSRGRGKSVCGIHFFYMFLRALVYTTVEVCQVPMHSVPLIVSGRGGLPPLLSKHLPLSYSSLFITLSSGVKDVRFLVYLVDVSLIGRVSFLICWLRGSLLPCICERWRMLHETVGRAR